MGFVDQIKKLLDDAAWNSAPVLEGAVEMRDPDEPLSLEDQIILLRDQTKGLRKAVLILADELDVAQKN